jgi:integrase
MTPKQIEQLVQHYGICYRQRGEDERESRSVDDEEREAITSYYSDRIEDAMFDLLRNDYRRIKHTADELLTEHKYTLPADSHDYQRLCRRLLQEQQRVFKTEIARWDGDYTQDFNNVVQARGVEGVSLAASKLFSEALKDYFAHFAHRDKRTNQEKAVCFKRFAEIVGADKPMEEITKADCIRFRDTFSRFPRRIPDKLRGKPIADMLKASEKKSCVTVTKVTVNLALDDLRHFFSWAIKHDHITGKNPIDGIAYDGVKQESYEAFTDDDLSRIFTTQQFISQRTGKHPERYWLLLLLAYSGARREEIAQMLVTDIRQDKDGLWFLDILPDDTRGTTVKNEASKRRTPLHSRLVDHGLLSYVDQIRKRHGDKSLLFPLSKKTKGRTTVGDATSKWFQRHRELVGVTGKKPLHSFRHTVVTRLIGAGVAQDKVQMVVGHTDSTVTGGIYTDRTMIPLTLLKKCLEKLHYPTLDHPYDFGPLAECR